MALNPWEYAAKTNLEHAHQTALFMFCNMARNFGLEAAMDPKSYSVKGYAAERWPFRGPNCVPQLEWLHAIKNQGHGDAIRGSNSKAEGVKSGVPDMFLPFPIRDFTVPLGTVVPVYYCGLYIELKRPSAVGNREGAASDKQSKWQNYLRGAGYKCEVIAGWEPARDCILEYLGLKLPDCS